MQAQRQQQGQQQDEGAEMLVDGEPAMSTTTITELQVVLRLSHGLSTCVAALLGHLTTLNLLSQTHGIASGDIAKLKDAGYHTCQAVAMATKKELCLVKGLSEAKVRGLSGAQDN